MKPYLHSALRFRAISSAKRILGSVRDSSVSVPYADYTIMPSFRPEQNTCDTNGLSARMNGNRPIPPPGVVTQTAHFSPRECVSPRSVPPAAGRCFFQTQKSSRPTLQESSTARSLSPICRPITPTISGLRSHSNCYLLLYHISASSLPSSTAGIYLRRIHSIGHDIRYRYTPGITSKRTGA